MEDSIFTKIIRGEIPCHKVYEDDRTFAFLDIHPVQPGHVLVVSKTQVEFIWDLNIEDYGALMTAVQLIGKKLRGTMDAPFVGVQVVGVDVPHAHVHLIPFSETSQLRNVPDGSAEPDHKALAAMAERLAR